MYRGAQSKHRPLPVRALQGAVRVLADRQGAAERVLPHRVRDVLDPRPDGRHLRLLGARRVLQAPAHRHRPAQRPDQARAERPRRAAAGHRRRRQGRSTSPTSRTCPRTPCSARARSRTSRWKGYLDFATCTECGRCQSQCPAWNTGKPLSPKLVIMNLRDHLFAKAPYIFGKEVPEGARAELHRRGRRPRARRPGVRLRARPGFGHRAGAAPAGRRPRVAAASSTRTSCGRAPRAAPASSSAPSTSSTSTTSSTCAATRC